MHELFLERLQKRLKGDLPGREAHEKMSPAVRGLRKNEISYKNAAVLLLLYPIDNEIYLVFIKRNEYKGHHSAQISFPGGAYEITDPDLQFTALRETEEEIGVKKSDILVLGNLTKLFIPVSNFCVHPYIAWVSFKPEFIPDISEVQYLLTPSLNELKGEEISKYGTFYKNGLSISAPYYEVANEIIWGATAMILSEFMELIDF